VVVEPIPNATLGLPYCSGFRLSVPGNGGASASYDLPLTYFGSLAQRGSAALVTKGLLQEDDRFYYVVAACPREQPQAEKAAPRFKIQEVPQPLPLHEAALAGFLEEATPFGRQDPADFPVFIPRQILEESSALALEAGARETGGVLAGYLRVDRSVPEVFLEVTALIPAQHTAAELTKLEFTADTWAAARAALRLRALDEGLYGWVHSHPSRWMCSAECPPEKRAQCPLMKNFFSQDDVEFHRTVFAKPYCVALVVTVTDDGLRHALFGWRQGAVHQRGFHILKPASSLPFVEAEATLGEPTHEPTCAP
jgi:proteasome lid subunit RPN8/RPN11